MNILKVTVVALLFSGLLSLGATGFYMIGTGTFPDLIVSGGIFLVVFVLTWFGIIIMTEDDYEDK